MTRLETNLSRLASHVDRGVTHLDAVLAATDGDGKQLINNVSRAAKSVGRDRRRDRALARSWPTSSMRRAIWPQMTGYMKAGQGTLGALVVDPTVYEQLVQVLGGVGRSRVLRALVRYAISRDDEQEAGPVVDDKNVPDVKAPKDIDVPKDVKRPHDSAKR